MTRAQRWLVRGLVAGCAVYGAVATPHAAVLFGLAALALFALGACSAHAQSVGEQEYMRSCATCHGVDGTSIP